MRGVSFTILLAHVYLAAHVVLTAMAAQDVEGIDVSHHNGKVDWTRVGEAGVSFGFAKATEGKTFRDSRFWLNFQGMKGNRIKAGAYHYLRGDVSAKDQADNFIQMLKNSSFDPQNDLVAIDVEAGSNEHVSAAEMADTLYDMLGNVSLFVRNENIYIYTGPSYWENNVAWNKYDFSKYKLWIAHYTTGAPRIPTTWRNITGRPYYWQYSETGHVDGVSGAVDLNREQ